MEKIIKWSDNSGNVKVTFDGSGDGTVTVESDANTTGKVRTCTFTISTTDGSGISVEITVKQSYTGDFSLDFNNDFFIGPATRSFSNDYSEDFQ